MAGGFVHAAAFHAHKAVLHQVAQAYPVFAAQLVQQLHHGYGRKLLAVYGHGRALFKA